MRDEIMVVPLTPAYIPDIVPLVVSMHEETGDLQPLEEDLPRIDAFYRGWLASGGMGLVALDDKGAVGFISFNAQTRPYHEPMTYGYTLHFYVKPEYRVTKIGGKLSKTAQAIVERAGITQLEFLVVPKAKIVDKWKRRGWKPAYLVMRKDL